MGGNITMAWNCNSGTGSLTVDHGSTLTAGGLYVGNNSNSTGSVTVNNSSTLTVGGFALALNPGNNVTGTLTLSNSSVMNAGGYDGGSNAIFNLDATSQLNLTGGWLTLDNATYNSTGAVYRTFPLVATPTNGKISVAPGVGLAIQDNWSNNASLSLDAGESGLQFGGLNLGIGVNTNNTASLNVSHAVVSFSGDAASATSTPTAATTAIGTTSVPTPSASRPAP